MLQELGADTPPLQFGRDISMAHQGHLALVLNAHHSPQLAFLFRHPELDSGSNLARQLFRRHVGLVPAVGRDYAAVGLRRVVDDRQHRRAIRGHALADLRHCASQSPTTWLKRSGCADITQWPVSNSTTWLAGCARSSSSQEAAWNMKGLRRP